MPDPTPDAAPVTNKATAEQMLELLRSWSDSDFAVVASGEQGEDLKAKLEGEISRSLDRLAAEAQHRERAEKAGLIHRASYVALEDVTIKLVAAEAALAASEQRAEKAERERDEALLEITRLNDLALSGFNRGYATGQEQAEAALLASEQSNRAPVEGIRQAASDAHLVTLHGNVPDMWKAAKALRDHLLALLPAAVAERGQG
jgi:hypothetical protein